MVECGVGSRQSAWVTDHALRKSGSVGLLADLLLCFDEVGKQTFDPAPCVFQAIRSASFHFLHQFLYFECKLQMVRITVTYMMFFLSFLLMRYKFIGQ